MTDKAHDIAQNTMYRLAPDTAWLAYRRELLAMVANIHHRPEAYQAVVESNDLPETNATKLRALWPYLRAWSEKGTDKPSGIPEHIIKMPAAGGATVKDHLFAPLFEVYYSDQPDRLARLYRLVPGASEAARQHLKARES